MNRFDAEVVAAVGSPLRAEGVEILQVSVGLRCNQRCRHCHVSASPERTETMSRGTMDRIVEIARGLGLRLVDITGGAPELNSDLLRFVAALREGGTPVQVRTNLTVLLEPGLGEVAGKLGDLGVGLVASLPCWTDAGVIPQRGEGVFEPSIAVLRKLNALGYGTRADLPLTIVHNPGGAALPGNQSALDAGYRRRLAEDHGVVFTRLITMTNVPTGRFRDDLIETGRHGGYLEYLEARFNPSTIGSLECRRQVFVDWDGRLYDCAFNVDLGLGVDHGAPDRLERFDAAALARRRIVTGPHCFACTAGAGSS
jgi:radical SAM/Cys-rich protein